ncbi:uncharacterized protein LOC129304767 [Prosopis cineraria]|uniref:uncharacterized protein LOC129304767 n=1 Tax=Prosopis cineraria TaxID=364024 RepID=UPI00240F548A|nr:uncharacterized protein LOC129304767 [Prosopis cineraria]
MKRERNLQEAEEDPVDLEKNGAEDQISERSNDESNQESDDPCDNDDPHEDQNERDNAADYPISREEVDISQCISHFSIIVSIMKRKRNLQEAYEDPHDHLEKDGVEDQIISTVRADDESIQEADPTDNDLHEDRNGRDRDENPDIDDAGQRETYESDQESNDGDDQSHRVLQIMDAENYLKAVKETFHSKREKYELFVAILRDFKAERINIADFLEKMKEVLDGHEFLILGLNVFLPKRYQIPPSHEQRLNLPDNVHKSEIQVQKKPRKKKTKGDGKSSVQEIDLSKCQRYVSYVRLPEKEGEGFKDVEENASDDDETDSVSQYFHGEDHVGP